MKWPAKKDAIANGSVSKPDEWSLGFNACHDEFMKVLQNDEIFLSFQKWLDGEGRPRSAWMVRAKEKDG